MTFTDDASNSETLTSVATGAVSAAANTAAAGAPAITGTAQVGETLTAGTAAITDGDGLTGVSYMYQWIRVAVDTTEADIASARAGTYTLVQADLGATIKVRVTFTDDASNSETLTSVATGAVSAAANNAPTASNGTVTQREDSAYYFRAADFNFSRGTGGGFTSLKITELPAVGRLTLNNVPINRFEVPKTIVLVRSSLRGLRYDPPDDAHGSPLATFKFKVNDGTRDSHIEYTMAVNITSVNDPAYGRPYIFGNTQVGHVIYGVARVVGDDDGIPATLNYQWKRYSADGNTFEADIGTNSNTYRLAPSDRGKKVMVEVSFTDDSGYQETVRSRLSPPIPGQTVDEITFQSIMGLGGDTFYDFTADHGQAFTTGTNPNGYTLSKVVIASEDGEADDVSVQICSVASNGDPTTACTTLTAPGGGFAKGHLSFTAPANTTLTGNRTNYMVVIKSPGGTECPPGRHPQRRIRRNRPRFRLVTGNQNPDQNLRRLARRQQNQDFASPSLAPSIHRRSDHEPVTTNEDTRPTLLASASHNSSLTGTSLLQPNAGLWEPYDGRLSRTVLREREGEVPSRHSPGTHRHPQASLQVNATTESWAPTGHPRWEISRRLLRDWLAQQSGQGATRDLQQDDIDFARREAAALQVEVERMRAENEFLRAKNEELLPSLKFCWDEPSGGTGAAWSSTGS